MMDTLTALVVAAVLTRGGPQPDPAPPGDDPVEIVIYDDERGRGVERCRIEMAGAPGSTCDVQPESDGEGLGSRLGVGLRAAMGTARGPEEQALMALIVQRDPDDNRHWTQVVEDIDHDLAEKFTKGRRCSLVCGDVECAQRGCVQKAGGS